jgi:GMP reductase
MRIENDVKLDYNNVLIRPKRSTLGSRSEVDLTRKYTFLNAKPLDGEHYHGIPVMAANMDGVATFEMAETLAELGLFTCLVKSYPKYELKIWIEEVGASIANHWAYSMGISGEDYSKFDAVYSAVPKGSIKYVCIDVANGYSERFVDYVKNIRDKYPELIIIAGNVVTGEMTEQLLLSGADFIKIGIGQGSVCLSRLVAGVGYPQLSAVIECADAAHGLGGHIIADGGCVHPGDVSKAFAGGADAVMLGGMLAGTDQGGGEIITKYYQTNEYTFCELTGDQNFKTEEKKFVQFYGMSSETANKKHFGGLKDYRASEGRTVLVDYKGDVRNVVQEILGGLRSTMTYVGASSLKQLSKCTTFIRCNDTHNRTFESKTVGK